MSDRKPDPAACERARAALGAALRRLIADYVALYTPEVRSVEREAMAYMERGDAGGMLKFLALKQEDNSGGTGNQYGAWWRLQTAMLADQNNGLLRTYLDWLRRECAYYWSEPDVLADERVIKGFLKTAAAESTGRPAKDRTDTGR